jgi:hypothetical protein
MKSGTIAVKTFTSVNEDGNRAIAEVTEDFDAFLSNQEFEEIISIYPQVTETLAADDLVYTRYTIMVTYDPGTLPEKE